MTPWPAWTLVPALAFAAVEARAQATPDSVRAAAPGISDTTATRAMPLRPALADLPSPSRATTTSLLGTLVPIAAGAAIANVSPAVSIGLISAGVLAGPLPGYVFGDCPGRGLQGFGGRAFATLIGGSITYATVAGTEGSTLGAAVPLAAIAVGVLGSTIYDIAVVGRHVRRRNDERLGLRPPAAPAPPLAPPTEVRSEPPMESGALERSLVGTLVPVAAGSALLNTDVYAGSGRVLIATGLIFGPLPGYTYGDCSRRGWTGAALRTGIAFTGFSAAFLLATSGEGFEYNPIDGIPAAVAVATVSVMTISAVYDVSMLPRHVRERNAARTGGVKVRMGLAPAVAPGTGAPALALVARF